MLPKMAGHILWERKTKPPVSFFFLSFFLSSFFPRLISAVGDWMFTVLRQMCGLSANLECRSEMRCTRLAANTGCKKSPSWLVLLRFQNVSCRSVSVGFAEKNLGFRFGLGFHDKCIVNFFMTRVIWHDFHHR